MGLAGEDGWWFWLSPDVGFIMVVQQLAGVDVM